MQSTLGGTQHGVLRRDELPRVIRQPCALHCSVPARSGFCPKLAQLSYPGGLEPALASAGKYRLCGKAILNRQTILEHPLEHRVAQQTRIDWRLHPCSIASGGPPGKGLWGEQVAKNLQPGPPGSWAGGGSRCPIAICRATYRAVTSPLFPLTPRSLLHASSRCSACRLHRHIVR